ncbi:putative ribosome recycling factor [Candidatus Carsonella ruddii HT isolate Thao2000]|uniref:Putative ribosome recycling factor n=1 Tax=Candidatus Carsonella ruddii HT isolate Thao2000 TaxID=1202539 RepID=J3YQ92_CARRU|nr:ribosome recycling factor [Candidatus Carsonella ruddii]AFP84068.1 putative ribosome recycling factor [Candidatus Carsonella ruddii HT isolate Thao2000]
MNIFITNKKNILEKIFINFKQECENFNIKNLNIETLNNLKIKLDKKIFFLKDICNIKIIKEKNFFLEFYNNEQFKKILKNNFFENIGFKIILGKNNLNLIIPNLSLEFRNKISNILKNNYLLFKENIENNRKKFIFEIKNNFKSKDEILFLEKNIEKEIFIIKEKLKKYFEKKIYNLLND